MNDEITIKAKLLKFTYSGFDFKYCDDGEVWEDAFTYYNNKPDAGDLPVNSVDGHFFDDCLVQVSAKEYETACIDRIKETIFLEEENEKKIVKKRGRQIALQFLPIISGGWYTVAFLNCDPRPHEEEYEITL